MIDLSGTPAPWPEDMVSLWAECIGAAARAQELWAQPAPAGDEVIRAQIGAAMQADPEQITIVSSLRAAALTYARRFDHIIVERPTYPGVLAAFADAAAAVRLLPWEELLHGDLPGDPGRTVLWLTSPCRNPDGASLTRAQETALRRRAEAGYRVVVNATYSWFADRPAPAGVDVAGSLHKLRGVGARLGWVASPAYFQDAVPELVGTTPPRVWQRAWGMFLRDGGLTMLRASCLAQVAAAAAAFTDRLAARHGCTAGTFEGPSALLPLAAGITEDDALARLRRRGFHAVASRHFFTTRPAIRVTFFGVTATDAARFADEAAVSGLFELASAVQAALT